MTNVVKKFYRTGIQNLFSILGCLSDRYRDHSFYYIPDVAGDQEPVAFQITSFDGKSFVAENPRNAFPKIIRYNKVWKKNAEYIEAAIEGDGEIISYVFQKLK